MCECPGVNDSDDDDNYNYNSLIRINFCNAQLFIFTVGLLIVTSSCFNGFFL